MSAIGYFSLYFLSLFTFLLAVRGCVNEFFFESQFLLLLFFLGCIFLFVLLLLFHLLLFIDISVEVE